VHFKWTDRGAQDPHESNRKPLLLSLVVLPVAANRTALGFIVSRTAYEDFLNQISKGNLPWRV